MLIVITGRANSGKTTLFNALTASNEKVGNWNGVTVKPQTKKAVGENYYVTDLPGLVSFSALTMEEGTACDYLLKNKYDLIINVISAFELDKGLELFNYFLSFKKPIINIINYTKEFAKKGGKIDFEKLNKISGAVFVAVELNRKKEIEKIKKAVNKSINGELKYDFNIKITNQNSFYFPPKARLNKIDNLFLTKAALLPLAIIVLGAAFYLAFGRLGLGSFLGGFLWRLAAFVTTFLKSRLGINFASSLLCDGLINGVFSVLVFLPQIFILEFCLVYLEQSGIISRLSFAFDGILNKVGLNGRALFCILMGFGCTTVAVTSADGLENNSLKKRLIYALPFVSCSAKMPVYAYFAAFVGIGGAAVIGSIYFLSVVFTLAFCAISGALKNLKAPPYIAELTPLRVNCIKNCLIPLKKSLGQFIIKVGTVVAAVSVVVFFLNNLSTDFKLGDTKDSILSFLGEGFSVFFKPIGLGEKGIGASLLCGLFAKESILSTLYLLYPTGLNLTLSQSLAIIIFVLFYTPCVSALTAIKRQNGTLSTLIIAVFQFLFALVLCYIVYFLCLYPIITIAAAAVAIAAIIYFFTRKNEKH